MANPGDIRRRKGPIEAVVRPPGSKSLTIRAIACAALAKGESTLLGPLVSNDTRVTRSAFRRLGVTIDDHQDDWVIQGSGGDLVVSPDSIDAGASGLTARILIGMAPLVDGVTTVTGRDRLPQRPMGGILEALASQGVSVTSADGYLPVTVHGTGSLAGGRITVSAARSTQFVTAILLPAPLAGVAGTIFVEDLRGSQGYIDLTVDVMRGFGARVETQGSEFRVDNGGYSRSDYFVEPDASAAVYPMVAAAITGGRVIVDGLGAGSRQPDYGIASVLEHMGCTVDAEPGSTTITGPGDRLEPIDVDLSGSPDGALAVAIACVRGSGASRIRGLESLRYKESNRLSALAAEINKIGGSAEIDESSLIIRPGPVNAGVIETYADHRIAMSFALLGLVADGIQIQEPEVVNKTWPGFWEMLDGL